MKCVAIVFAAVVVVLSVPRCASDSFDYSTDSNNNRSGSRSRNSNDDAANYHRYAELCMNISPQHSVDIKQIFGTWYGTEIIRHTPAVPGTFHINSCVVIQILDVTQQMQTSSRHYNYNSYTRASGTGPYHQSPIEQEQKPQQLLPQQQAHLWSPKYLRFIWTEKDDNLEYTFNYTEYSPGMWTNVGDQRGSLAALNKYTQFHGTVQVVKAVHDHLVLTFCGSDEQSFIYTLVLSRQEHGLSAEELRSIRNLLSRRKLSTDTIHKVCSSAAGPPLSSISAWLLLTCSTALIAARELWSRMSHSRQ